MAETEKSVELYLLSCANDLRLGKPIESVLDDLEDAMEEWRNEWSKEDD